MLGFEERGEPEYPGKNLSEQRKEPTNSARIMHLVREFNPSDIHWKVSIVFSPSPRPVSQEKIAKNHQCEIEWDFANSHENLT